MRRPQNPPLDGARGLCRGDPGIALPLPSEDLGLRHFIITAPDGVLIAIIQQIEPTPEHAQDQR